MICFLSLLKGNKKQRPPPSHLLSVRLLSLANGTKQENKYENDRKKEKRKKRERWRGERKSERARETGKVRERQQQKERQSLFFKRAWKIL